MVPRPIFRAADARVRTQLLQLVGVCDAMPLRNGDVNYVPVNIQFLVEEGSVTYWMEMVGVK